MSKIGFIGLGIMGRPMAGHLIAGGHKLFIHGHGTPPKELLDQGAVACPSARDVARERRHRHHHGARHAECGGRPIWPGRRRRGPFAGQDRRRHEQHLADRDQGLRQADQRARLRLSRRAGLRRRRRGQGGKPDDHGRRSRAGLRNGEADLRADGQEHHAGRRQRRRADHQGRQPDHRRADHRGGRRSAGVRLQGGRRSGARAPGVDGRLRRPRASSRSMASGWSSAISSPASASPCTRRT